MEYNRRSIRLKGYDYSKSGLYFVTINTYKNQYLFGDIVHKKMVLNKAGIMVNKIWNEIPSFYNNFDIHEFIIMPTHIHGIIEIRAGAQDEKMRVGMGTYPYRKGNAPMLALDADGKELAQSNDHGYGGNDEDGKELKLSNAHGVMRVGMGTYPYHKGNAPMLALDENHEDSAKSLGDIVHRFKLMTTNEYIHNVNNNNWDRFKKKIWHRNYYEYIIRHKEDYEKISKYIKYNPNNWDKDNLEADFCVYP
jgi:REP element-mobilizing transposase RayT